MLSEYVLAFGYFLTLSLFVPLGFLVARTFITDFRSAYVVSKLLGLLIFAYLIWLSSSLRILDFQNIWFIRAIFLLAIVVPMGLLVKEFIQSRKTIDWSKVRTAFYIESANIILYLLYLWVRSHNVEIHGTERFMDMAIFKSISMTNYFPPIDSWFAGHTINYYYYGHYLFSLISNLAGISSNYGYTFALATIFSTSFMLAWAFIRKFTESKILTVLGAFMVVMAGTAAFAFCIFSTYGECSYVKSTRLYEPSYIINEVPSYSFTVGDLHAHLIALPFFLLFITLMYELFTQKELKIKTILFLAISLSTLGMINTWDFVTVVILVGIMVLFKVVTSEIGKTFFEKIFAQKVFIIKMLLLGLTAVAFMLPFLLSFQSGAAGLGFAPIYSITHNLSGDAQYPTPIAGWLGMWGIFLVILLICVLLLKQKFFDLKKYPLVLIFVALILLIFVELFFIQDIYSYANPPYFRANSVFKFGFHTWTLLSLSTVIFASEALKSIEKNIKNKMLQITLFSLLSLMSLFGLMYPIKAIDEFYLSSQYDLSLDGTNFLAKFYPKDLATINWLNNNVKQRNVLVEAAGGSYTEASRISSFTGQINPINWMTHEWGWHFKPSTDGSGETGWGPISTIEGEVKYIYESTDIDFTKQLLSKYDVKYVYIGDLERSTYTNLQEAKFAKLGKVVFTAGDSVLYEINLK